MHALDFVVVAVYALVLVGIGAWLSRQHQSEHSYFVGDGTIGSGHLGLSIAATDVGGGFSIGLGGLGFTMGLSGSWLLFTGLIGAWVVAVVLIPRIKPLGDAHGWSSYAQYLEHRYDRRVRLCAAVVAALGYAAFTGAQILAGAKLAAVAFELDISLAILAMALIVVAYTSLGGLKAVVFTDTLQWIVLLGGLSLLAVPLALEAAGGLAGLQARVPQGHLSFTEVSAAQLAGWFLAIVPIWFVGNTLYQRIFAARGVAGARRAFYLAGLCEWPLMAVVGAGLGVLGRALFPDADPESAVPLLIREVLPMGAAGLVLAAYFSAIMSTADSCLLAAVGHLVTDLDAGWLRPQASDAERLRTGRILTLVVGLGSSGIALAMPSVLEAVLLSYAFMVSGLFVPTAVGLFWRRASARGALWSMLCGGTTAVVLSLWEPIAGLDPVAVAMGVAVVPLLVLRLPPVPPEATEPAERSPVMA